ncbi:YhbY family RNA-binding protein [archaeon]|nr:YhbY family RNA-binding protein [archaeon]
MNKIKKLQIGKNGLTPEFVEQLKRIFENEQMLKITILKSACRDKKVAEKMADELLEMLGKNYTYRLVGYTLTIRKWRKPMR